MLFYKSSLLYRQLCLDNFFLKSILLLNLLNIITLRNVPKRPANQNFRNQLKL